VGIVQGCPEDELVCSQFVDRLHFVVLGLGRRIDIGLRFFSWALRFPSSPACPP